METYQRLFRPRRQRYNQTFLQGVSQNTKKLNDTNSKGYKHFALFFAVLCSLSLTRCYPADPDYKIKPLQNTEHTGFISRNFFQVIVTGIPEPGEKTLMQERASCRKNALQQRDRVTLAHLKKIVQSQKRTALNPKSPTKEKKEKVEIQFPNILLNRGDFDWFLNKLQLHMEDYSELPKCKFIFRAFGKNLYKRVLQSHITKQTLPKNGT